MSVKPPVAPEPPKATVPTLPESAVTGTFVPGEASMYAYVGQVDHAAGSTFIAFQDKKYPTILVPKTYGGDLEILKLEGFDRDVLMLRARLRDTQFYKYFPFVLRNNQWEPLTNGFAIHKSNRPDTIARVLKRNMEVPSEVIRYYSVFDLDTSGDTGYTWRLLTESVPIQE